MKLSTSFIAVKKITSSVPASNFSSEELNHVAELILKAEGIINPLVLRRTSPQSYEVVDGHFEFYAAVRSKEIDSQKGEYIGAFIIEPENEEVLLGQIEALRKTEPEPIGQIKSQIQQLEKSLQDKIDTLTSKVDQLEERTTVRGLEDILDKQLKAIRQESSNLTKEEALSLLTETQNNLSKQLEATYQAINSLNRVNLLTANKDEVEQALKRVKGDKKASAAAWSAIEHWKQPGRKLTWDNLKKSATAKAGSKDKVPGFSDGTYKKLQKIGNIGI